MWTDTSASNVGNRSTLAQESPVAKCSVVMGEKASKLDDTEVFLETVINH